MISIKGLGFVITMGIGSVMDDDQCKGCDQENLDV
jgi:hypothetical protein